MRAKARARASSEAGSKRGGSVVARHAPPSYVDVDTTGCGYKSAKPRFFVALHGLQQRVHATGVHVVIQR